MGEEEQRREDEGKEREKSIRGGRRKRKEIVDAGRNSGRLG